MLIHSTRNGRARSVIRAHAVFMDFHRNGNGLISDEVFTWSGIYAPNKLFMYILDYKCVHVLPIPRTLMLGRTIDLSVFYIYGST